jgi:hypothetical protein
MDVAILKNIFAAVVLLNIPLAIFSFYFSFILIHRRNDRVAFNFGMAVLFLGLWLVTLLALFLRFLPISSDLLVNLTYVFGVAILNYFFLFTLCFPILRNKNYTFIRNLVSLLSLGIGLSALVPGLYSKVIKIDGPLIYLETNPLGLSIYSLYFVALTLLIINNLWKSYVRSDGHYRVVIKRISISSSIAIIVNFFVSILVFFVWTFDTAPLGALTTSVAIYYIYLILYRD